MANVGDQIYNFLVDKATKERKLVLSPKLRTLLRAIADNDNFAENERVLSGLNAIANGTRKPGQKFVPMTWYFTDIEKLTRENNYYRHMLNTEYKGPQLGLMCINKETKETGVEVHHDSSQFIRFEMGEGMMVLDGVVQKVRDGTIVNVSPGVQHNIIQTGEEPLKLYTIYSQAEHEIGEIQITKPKE